MRTGTRRLANLLQVTGYWITVRYQIYHLVKAFRSICPSLLFKYQFYQPHTIQIHVVKVLIYTKNLITHSRITYLLWDEHVEF